MATFSVISVLQGARPSLGTDPDLYKSIERDALRGLPLFRQPLGVSVPANNHFRFGIASRGEEADMAGQTTSKSVSTVFNAFKNSPSWVRCTSSIKWVYFTAIRRS
jgi:hypothetical protein